MIIKKSKSTDRDIKLSMAAQKKVFSSISLLLLGYAIFWCLPLIVLIISEVSLFLLLLHVKTLAQILIENLKMNFPCISKKHFWADSEKGFKNLIIPIF